MRRTAAENAAGWAAAMRSVAAEQALLDPMIEAEADHHRALAALAGRLGALGAEAQAHALRLELQQWLAQGAEGHAADAARASAEAARVSHAAALAADAWMRTVEGVRGRVQAEDAGSALAREAHNAASACLDTARALAELDRSAHDAAASATQLRGHPAAEAARQAQALARQLADAIDTATRQATGQCSASQQALGRLQRQRADRVTAGHRAEAEQAGWQAVLRGLPSGSSAAADDGLTELAAAAAAEAEARALRGHRQEGAGSAKARQAGALALQQALQAPLLAARSLAPALQAALQAAAQAEPAADALLRHCGASLALACHIDALQQVFGHALQALGAVLARAQARGSSPRPGLDAALAQAAQQHQAVMADLAIALPVLTAAQCSAGRAAAAAATLVAAGQGEAGARPVAEVQAALQAELAGLAQAQDGVVQACARALESAVSAEAESQAALLRAQGQVSAATAADAAARQP
ncbi:hypothetical protein [Aquabacterium sp.]|uniref:hypothetical protein n=1 Tax=Aquabacterium sp. TaxID=1872578 RepID=UPI003784184A